MAQAAPVNKTAAFYDVDGTLIKTNIVHAFAWYARHQPTLTGSLVKSAKTALSIPMFLIADKLSRKVFNQLFYGYYAGEPEDRLVVLAEELFEDVIKPSIFPRARDLVEQSRRSGARQVLISGGLDFTVRPLARYLGVDDFIANTLEFENGYATGHLGKPFVAGATKAVDHARLRREARHRPDALVRLFRFLFRLSDARRRRPSDGGESRLETARDGAFV